MSSFTMVLLEDGMEMELPTDLTNVITILDQEVPHFQYEGHTYKVSAGKATLGTRWDLVVESINMRSRDQGSFNVGRIELEKLDNRMVQFRIPPRHEQEETRDKDMYRDGKIFGSFIFHLLNTLQGRDLIHLPGVLPTV